MATKKTNTPTKPASKKTTSRTTRAKTTKKAPKKTTTRKPRTKKAVQATAVQTAVQTTIPKSSRQDTTTGTFDRVRFESRNPLDYFLRLDVLIALSLFFLLVTTVISFTVIRQEVAELQTAVSQLEEIIYER